MFYTIYQVTNKKNNKIYIGKHQTKDLNDNYLGSGVNLNRAIRKYGVKNFEKQILFVFDNEQEMNDKEKQLVTEDFCNRKDTYNICVGGKGGFSYINKFVLTKQDRQKRGYISEAARKKQSFLIKNDSVYRSNFIKIRAPSLKRGRELQKKLYPNGLMFGKKHSKQAKQKMSVAKQGNKNNQFGTMWITNGTENKKIKAVDNIPIGWYKGRKLRSYDSVSRKNQS